MPSRRLGQLRQAVKAMRWQRLPQWSVVYFLDLRKIARDYVMECSVRARVRRYVRIRARVYLGKVKGDVVKAGPTRPERMDVNRLKNLLYLIYYLFHLMLGRILFPVMFTARLVDRRTQRPLSGVRLVLEATNERMMLPGYPCTVDISDQHGLVCGTLEVGGSVIALV